MISKNQRKWTAWTNIKLEREICLKCPLPDCISLDKGCKRLQNEIRKLKNKGATI